MKTKKDKKLGSQKVKSVGKKSVDNIIERDGYSIYILTGKDEKQIIELQNTGKTIGVIRYDDPRKPADEDEVIVAVRN